jgi:hypothetical protein
VERVLIVRQAHVQTVKELQHGLHRHFELREEVEVVGEAMAEVERGDRGAPAPVVTMGALDRIIVAIAFIQGLWAGELDWLR